MNMYEPPRKRTKTEPFSITTIQPTNQSTSNSLPLYHPSFYVKPNSTPTAFQQPLHLTSFSYSTNRDLLLSDHNKDESLSFYREPKIGSNLNFGFEDCTWREEGIDEGLDSLLESLTEYISNNSAGLEILSKTHVITWRGMMTKLLLAIYEAQNGRSSGWEMNCMIVNNILYLEESITPASIISKSNSEQSFKSQSYMGYSFESYSTTSSSPSPSTSEPEPDFSIPNTNVQWCSIVKTNLGGFRILLGGEVDCLADNLDTRERCKRGEIKTSDFIELKTNIVIESQRDEVNFEKQKLLKHYIQSFLLGVPQIIVGFRTRAGELTAIQSFKTLEIPRLVRGKPHAFDPLACLASGKTILDFIYNEVKKNQNTKKFQSKFFASTFDNNQTSNGKPENDEPLELNEWPVFRIKFNPKSSIPDILIRELSKLEIQNEVLADKVDKSRVGFLPLDWVNDRIIASKELN